MTKPTHSAEFLKGRAAVLDEMLGLLHDATCDAYMAGRDTEADAFRRTWQYVVARSKEAYAALCAALCDNKRQYSFDDLGIGSINQDGSCLATCLVNRPKGLTNTQWYKFAEQVINLLNAKE